MSEYKNLRFVFDRMPDQYGCTFIECETEEGASINAGEWRNRPDGLAELVVPVNYAAQSELAALREELARKDVVIEELMQSNGDMTTCLKSAERHEPHCLLLDPEEPDCNCNCVVS